MSRILASMVVAIVVVVVGGCPSSDSKTVETPRAKAATRDVAARGSGSSGSANVSVAPGLRLPEGVAPLAYDVRLELDPTRETFVGRVVIRVKIEKPTREIWLHADELEIGSAVARAQGKQSTLVVGLPTQHEMISLTAAAPLVGEVALELDFSGHVGDALEGLFRQKIGGKSFLYSQAEATYARRILPCFDEPRFKVPWKVTLVVPVGNIALANAPSVHEQAIDGLKRVVVEFEEITNLPSHLFAVAVGPFTMVDIGTVGKNHVPVHVAVAGNFVTRTVAARTWTPKLVDALEVYFDKPLPLAKLDLVAVPRFFGAMENPGLITFEHSALLGNEKEPVFVRRHIRFVAHELAHQWVGNAVTPAWWNDLWLAEAFATWMDDKMSKVVGPVDDPALRTQLARAHALAADRDLLAKPLRRPIETTDDIEDAFDAISYEKGAAVLSMFEQYVGEEKFRDVMRAYIHGAGTARAEDFVAQFAKVDAVAAKAFAGYLDHAGAPVVDMKLECARADANGGGGVGMAKVIATPRDGASVPICVRHPGGKSCAMAIGATTIELSVTSAPTNPTGAPASCPAWVIGNAEGRGYYYVQWPADAAKQIPEKKVEKAKKALRKGTDPPDEAAPLTSAERLAAGEDRAAAIARGELSTAQALAEIDELLSSNDPYREIAAIAMAVEIDRRVPERDVGGWADDLAKRFAKRLTRAAIWQPKGALAYAIREEILELVPPPKFAPDAAQRAKELVAKALRDGPMSLRSSELVVVIALAAPAGGKALYEKIVDVAANDPMFLDEWLEGLSYFDASFAPRAVELVLDKRFEPDHAWDAVGGMFARTATRAAAWRAVKARLGELQATLGAHDSAKMIEATATLCGFRSEIEAAFSPHVKSIEDGKRALAQSLAAIDKCVATSSGAPTNPPGP